jgi:hypothetical protein
MRNEDIRKELKVVELREKIRPHEENGGKLVCQMGCVA